MVDALGYTVQTFLDPEGFLEIFLKTSSISPNIYICRFFSSHFQQNLIKRAFVNSKEKRHLLDLCVA